MLALFIPSLCALLASAQLQAAELAAASKSETDSSIPAGLLALGSGDYFSPYAFVVDKHERRMTLWHQKDGQITRVATYPIDFGRSDGKKQRSGDFKTPEGIYFLMDQLEGPQLDFNQYGKRAFTTNYPNLFDLREGKTGNGIWLHAIPDKVPLTRGSRGCVVVRNEVILELSKYVKLRQTPIVIYGEVARHSLQDRERELQQNVLSLEKWRAAWESKKIDDYMEFYSDNFESLGYKKSKWRRYKDALNKTYDSIQVKFSQPVIYRHNDQMVTRFLQAYSSDKKADYGEKTLYWRLENGTWRIVSEQWSEVRSPLAYHDLKPPEGLSQQACVDCKPSDSGGMTRELSSTQTASSPQGL